MNTYILLKHVHMTCVALSFSFFVLRFYWRLQDSRLLQNSLVKVLPHVVDTCLLISAISLAWIAQINPLSQYWLSAKIIALLMYIVLGSFAIKRATTRRGQLLSFSAACASFTYIILVAISKQAIPFIAL